MKIATLAAGMKIAALVLLIASNVFAAAPWEILTQGAAEENSTKRAQAIIALGTIRTPRAEKLVMAALSDKSATVRLAAVSALADQKSRAAIPKLKLAVDDEAAEVSFSAAKALWEMGDHSGAGLLAAVLAGERKTSAGFVKKGVDDAKSTMHSPKKLVWMGARQGAGFLFGPLGFGLGMVEGLTNDASAPARALSATLLGQSKSPEVRDELEDGLEDRNPLVRVAVAKALGGFSDRALVPKLEPLLDDKSDAVRYMAAAAIVRIEMVAPRVKTRVTK
jgi:HEAT repeat protein